MRRLALLAAAAATGLVGATGAASAPKAKPLCVGNGAKCFATIQAALDAAQDGDSIQIYPGTYPGGFTIDKSVSLVGVNANAVTIRGGGPVVTIGEFFAASEPTVSISGVTITGGATSSSPQADLFFGIPGAWAIGGGVYIPPADGFAPGASVTISDSVVSGNSASPTDTFVDPTNPGWPVCPHGLCPFAGASGGGIADDGNLTLIRTTVSDNSVTGPTASDSDGGGIWEGFAGGSLTLRNSTVRDNTASASDPNGRFAEGGGIFTDFGDTVSIDGSQITGNTASLTSSFPFFVDGDQTLEIAANSGGMHMGDGGSLTVTNTHIDRNAVTATDLNGEPEVFDSGLCDCGGSTMTMRTSTVSNNLLTADVGSNADVFACCGFSAGGALEFDWQATIDNVRITGNETTVTSPAGAAIASGTVASFFPVPPTSLVSNSVVRGNQVTASSQSGSATILGVGVLNAAGLDLQRDRISDNRGTATAPDATAQGGGIWNGPFPGGPPVQLSLEGTTVTHNMLGGSNGAALQGAGLYSCGAPFTLDTSQITGNTPDQIFACPGFAASALFAPASVRGAGGHTSGLVLTDGLVLREGASR